MKMRGKLILFEVYKPKIKYNPRQKKIGSM